MWKKSRLARQTNTTPKAHAHSALLLDIARTLQTAVDTNQAHSGAEGSGLDICSCTSAVTCACAPGLIVLKLTKMMATSQYVSVNENVTVNNGFLTCPAGGGRQVLVTPIVAGSQQRVQADRAISAAGRVLVSTLPQLSHPQQSRIQLPSQNVLPKVLLKKILQRLLF